MALKDEILAMIASKIEGQGTAVDAGSALPGILRGIIEYVDGIAAGIPAAQIQSDWTQADNTKVDFIKNKPTIPAAQVNADWNAESGVAQILNKPTIPAGTLIVEVSVSGGGDITTSRENLDTILEAVSAGRFVIVTNNTSLYSIVLLASPGLYGSEPTIRVCYGSSIKSIGVAS